jgi:hypothetical protein
MTTKKMNKMMQIMSNGPKVRKAYLLWPSNLIGHSQTIQVTHALQPWTPPGCARCEPESCTQRFKCRVSHEFISIKWVCITMGLNQTMCTKTNIEKKMAIGLTLTYITQCWLLKVDQKLCLQHDSRGVPITPFRNHLYGVTLIRHRKS